VLHAFAIVIAQARADGEAPVIQALAYALGMAVAAGGGPGQSAQELTSGLGRRDKNP
jgi:hypothetical protein